MTGWGRTCRPSEWLLAPASLRALGEQDRGVAAQALHGGCVRRAPVVSLFVSEFFPGRPC